MRKGGSTNRDRAASAPLFVRPLLLGERLDLEAAVHSSDYFTLRRSQIVLASARGDHVYKIAHTLGCSKSTVKGAIRDFNAAGVGALDPHAFRPHGPAALDQPAEPSVAVPSAATDELPARLEWPAIEPELLASTPAAAVVAAVAAAFEPARDPAPPACESPSAAASSTPLRDLTLSASEQQADDFVHSAQPVATLERPSAAAQTATLDPPPEVAPAEVAPAEVAPAEVARRAIVAPDPLPPGYAHTGIYARPPKTWWQRWSRLVVALMLLVAALVGTRGVASFAAADNQLVVHVEGQQPIDLDLAASVARSPYIFGMNVFPATGTQATDGAAGFMPYDALTTQGLTNAGVTMLRFPGGSWGESHTPSYEQINAFLKLAQQTHATPLMQVRLHGGSPEQAAALVSYVNNPHNALRQQYPDLPFVPVHYWVVGNEPDLIGSNYTVADYVHDYTAFAAAMKQVDPAIQILGPELSQFNGVNAAPRDASGTPWLEGFLQGVANYEHQTQTRILDGIAVHIYPFSTTTPSNSLLFASSGAWQYMLPPLQQETQQILGRSLPIGITEINTDVSGTVAAPLPTAMWWADTLGTLEAEHVAYVDFFAARGVNNLSTLLNGNGGATPLFRVMQLYRQMAPQVVPTRSDVGLISVYPTTDAALDTLTLLVVNKSPNIATIAVDPVRAFSAWQSREFSVPPYAVVSVVIPRSGGGRMYVYAPSAQTLAAGQSGDITQIPLP